MSAHTPEPWRVGVHALQIIYAPDGWAIADAKVFHLADGADAPAVQKANAARIVACVNACAGMADPVEEVAQLKRNSCGCPDQGLRALARQRDELLKALESIEEYWNGGEGSAVDAAEEMRDRARDAIAKAGAA